MSMKSPSESITNASAPLTGVKQPAAAVVVVMSRHQQQQQQQSDPDIGRKSSYSVQTLKRILLLSSVTKQTTSTSDQSKNMLQSRLQSEAGTTKLQSEVDTAILLVERLRNRMKCQTDCLSSKQQSLHEAVHLLTCRQTGSAELVKKMKSTTTCISNLKITIEQEKNKLSAARESLEKRRARLIQELATCIYPVLLPENQLPTICGFMLPDISSPAGHNHQATTTAANAGANTPSPYSWSKFFGAASKTGISEEGLSIAVGCVAHMLLLISKFTDIPLKYDLQHGGSRSHVIDHLNIETWKQILGQMGSPSPGDIAGHDHARGSAGANDRFGGIRNRAKRDGVQVSLFIVSKGSKDSRVYFDYGLFLLNQVIAQIKWTLCCLHRRHGRSSEFRKIDLTQTLTNVHDIITIYSNFLIESNSNFITSSPNHSSVVDSDFRCATASITTTTPTTTTSTGHRPVSPTSPSVSGLRRGSRSSSLPPQSSSKNNISSRTDDTFLNREIEAMLRGQEEVTGDRSSSVSTSDELLTASSRSQSVPQQINHNSSPVRKEESSNEEIGRAD